MKYGIKYKNDINRGKQPLQHFHDNVRERKRIEDYDATDL